MARLCTTMLMHLFLLLTLAGFSTTNAQHSNPSLFSPFEHNSIEYLDHFKTKIFKLIEAQNQYFEIIQQKRPNQLDYEYAKFDVKLPLPGGEQHPPLDNSNLFTIPSPNIASNQSQIFITLDVHNTLLIWDFQTAEVAPRLLGKLLMKFPEHHPVKLRSFISEGNEQTFARRQKFSIQVVILFLKKDATVTSDLLVMFTISGLLNHGRLESNVVEIREEQLMRFEQITDCDVLYQNRRRIYLGLIQSSWDSNFKYELSLYRWNGFKFDKTTSQISDYVLNANRLKLAMFDGGLYLICSHRAPPMDSTNEMEESGLNIFQYIEEMEGVRGTSRIAFLSAVNNASMTVRGMFHLSGNNDFIFLLMDENIDVYWWDGRTLIYYDTLYERKPITFDLWKLETMPPLIISSDGLVLHLYYKEYSKFVRHELLLSPQPGYSVDKMKLFDANGFYYVWVKFADLSSAQARSSYVQILKVHIRRPDDDEEIYNLDTCLADLKARIDRGVSTAYSLDRRSQDLLVITPEKPWIEVDVIVNDTFRTHRVAPQIHLKVPEEQIYHGRHVQGSIQSTGSQLAQLNDRLDKSVLRKSGNQTIASPIEFMHPVTVGQLTIDRIEEEFYLNGFNFGHYANNCLTLHTDQTIETQTFGFFAGVHIDELVARSVNQIEDLGKAILVQGVQGTQFIPASHRYTSLELLNGTTAPFINDVRLVDVYQDVATPTQLLRGKKHFHNVSLNELTVDTVFNGVNFARFLHDAVWLDGTTEVQQIRLPPGQQWQLLAGFSASDLVVANKINNLIDITYLLNNTARNDREMLITGPIYFQGDVTMSNLNLNGLVNRVDLQREALLARFDQDFISPYNDSGRAQLSFRQPVKVDILGLDRINELFGTEHMVLNNGFDPVVHLVGKQFDSPVTVLGSVQMGTGARINGVDISELYGRLDGAHVFNTVVNVGELVVNGEVSTSKLNGHRSFALKERLNNIWLRDRAQTIAFPFSYFGATIHVDRLNFDTYKGHLRFPQHFVSANNNNNKEVVITGRKYFANPVHAQRIDFGRSGLLNGRRLKDVFDQMAHISGKQTIGGVKTFNTLVVEGDLVITTGTLNDRPIDAMVSISSSNITSRLWFDHLVLAAPTLVVRNKLQVNGNLLGTKFDHFLADVVTRQQGKMSITLHNKHFHPALSVEEIVLNGTIGRVELGRLMSDAFLIQSPRPLNITAFIHFDSANLATGASHFDSLNGLPLSWFRHVVVRDQGHTVDIHGVKYFHGNFIVETQLDSPHLINDRHNLTHLVSNSMVRVGNQQVNGRHVFLRPITVVDLHLPFGPGRSIRINEIPINNWVRLNQKEIVFENDIIFDHHLTLGNVNIVGNINQCNLTRLLQEATHINPKTGTFTIRGLEITPVLTVVGDVRFVAPVNNQPSFVRHLVSSTHSSAPPPVGGKINFAQNVWSNRIVVNDLVNNKNITTLLNDAVYVDLAQVITGRKRFRRPLKIIGSVRPVTSSRVVASLGLGGRLNGVNMTRLLHSVVRVNNTQQIVGRKVFTGRLTFGGDVTIHGWLNEHRVPEDLVLVHTNEVINTEVRFNKKLKIHRNLNAHLINRVNLTKFIDNVVLIDTPTTEPIAASLIFVQPVNVHSLLVRNTINDIPVEQFVTLNAPGRLGGRKVFRQPLHIRGQVLLPSGHINGLDINKTIAEQWIDRRRIGNEPKLVTGSITFDQPVIIESMDIRRRINKVDVDKVNERHLEEMERYLETSDKSLVDIFTNVNRTERALESQLVGHHHLARIKYLRLVEVLPDEAAVAKLTPIIQQRHRAATGLVATFPLNVPGHGGHCVQYRNRVYGLLQPASRKLLIERPAPSAAIASQGLTMINSINSEQVAVLATRGRHCAQGNSSLVHRVIFVPSLAPGVDLSMALYDIVATNGAGAFVLNFPQSIIKVAMFTVHTKPVAKHYLLLLSGKQGLATVMMYRWQVGGPLEKLTPPPPLGNILVRDFDLIAVSGGDILLAVAGVDAKRPATSSVLRWAPQAEHFVRHEDKTDQGMAPEVEGAVFTAVKFIVGDNSGELYLAFALGDTDSCHRVAGHRSRQFNNAAAVDIYRIHSQRPMTLVQRLYPRAQQVQQIVPIKVGSMLYLGLVAPTSVELYQHEFFNRFQSIYRFKAKDVESVFVFRAETSGQLYLAIASALPNESQLLHVVLGGGGGDPRTITTTESLLRLEDMWHTSANISVV